MMESLRGNLNVKHICTFCALAAALLLNPLAALGAQSPEQAKGPSDATHSMQSNASADWSKGAHIRNIIRLKSGFFDSVEFSPDSQYLLVTAGAGDTAILNVSDGTKADIMKDACYISWRVWLTPDSRYLITDSVSNTHIWSFPDGAAISSFSKQEDIYTRPLVVSNNGKYVVTWSEDMSASVFEVPSGDIICRLTGFKSRLYSASFSIDDQYLATAEKQETKIWRVNDWRITGRIPTDFMPSLSFVPGMQYLLAADHGFGTTIWTVPHGAFVAKVPNSLNVSAISPDSEYFVSVYYDLSSEHTRYAIGLYTLPEAEMVHSCITHSDYVNTLAFNPDGRFFASGGNDNLAYIYSVPGCEVVEELKYHDKEVEFVVFSPDGRYLATAGRDGRVIIWEPNV
jgi:WD40 repeat protein